MLLDTNVVSEFLRAGVATRFPKLEQLVRDAIEAEDLKIAFITQFELLRLGIKQETQHQGLRKLVALHKFLDRCSALGLDDGAGAGWNHAAALWAKASLHKPSIVFSDADLLIAATASFHEETLLTFDVGLAQNLQAIGFEHVTLVPRE
jgi:predicted nucleic acid-binding protein